MATGESSSSKSLMWMVLALFVGVAIMLGGGLLMAKRVLKNVGLTASASGTTIHTKGGTYRLEREKEVGPGLPVYPGASLVVPSDKDALTIQKESQANISRSNYYTSDTRESVDLWYKDRLSKEFTRFDAGQTSLPEIYAKASIGANQTTFVAQRSNHVRIISLADDSTGTKISLIRVETAEPSSSPAPQSTQPAEQTPQQQPQQ